MACLNTATQLRNIVLETHGLFRTIFCLVMTLDQIKGCCQILYPHFYDVKQYLLIPLLLFFLSIFQIIGTFFKSVQVTESFENFTL